MPIAVTSEMPRTDHGPKQRVARMDRRVIVVTALGADLRLVRQALVIRGAASPTSRSQLDMFIR